MNNLQRGWDDYVRSVYPDGVTSEQRKQLHRAFFAGTMVACSEMHLAAKSGKPSAVTGVMEESMLVCRSISATAKGRN